MELLSKKPIKGTLTSLSPYTKSKHLPSASFTVSTILNHTKPSERDEQDIRLPSSVRFEGALGFLEFLLRGGTSPVVAPCPGCGSPGVSANLTRGVR